MKTILFFVLVAIFLASPLTSFADSGKDWMKDCPGPACPADGRPVSKPSENARTGKDWMKDCPGPKCPSDKPIHKLDTDSEMDSDDE